MRQQEPALKSYCRNGNSDAILSPTTIEGYKVIKQHAFQNIMDTKLKDIMKELLQIAVNEESKRKRERTEKQISPKTVKNEYGLITAVLNVYYPSLDCTVRLPDRPVVIKELLQPDVIFDAVKGTSVELPVLLTMWLSFSMSEIRGIRKSTSIKDGYITIRQVVVDVKTFRLRNRRQKPTRASGSLEYHPIFNSTLMLQIQTKIYSCRCPALPFIINLVDY